MNPNNLPPMNLAGDPNTPMSHGGATRPSVIERANEALDDVVDRLIRLHYDVYGAYRIADDRVQDPDALAHLASLEAEHAHSLRELQEYVRAHGRTPPDGGDYRALWTRGRVHLGRLRGLRGVVKAMARNEQTIHRAYRRIVGQRGIPTELRALLTTGLELEREHVDHLAHTL